METRYRVAVLWPNASHRAGFPDLESRAAAEQLVDDWITAHPASGLVFEIKKVYS